MAKVEASAVINRPIEEIFAFVVDIDKMPLYHAVVVETKNISEGPRAWARHTPVW